MRAVLAADDTAALNIKPPPPGAWFATMEEIAAHVKACREDGSWQPRIEEMPYYEGRIAEWEPKQEMPAE